MPGYNGTGPDGAGSRGRGLGPCGRGFRPTNRGFLGFGRGRGFGGRGFWQGRLHTAGSVTDEKTQLVSEREWLSQQLDLINQRLGKIEDKE